MPGWGRRSRAFRDPGPLTEPAPPTTRRSIPGTLGRVLAFCLLFLVLEAALGGLLAAPIAWFMARTGKRLQVDELFMLASALAATAIMLRTLDVRPWADVGLSRRAASPRTLLVGGCIGALSIAAVALLLLPVGWLRIEPASPGSSLGAAARISTVLIPAALFEEILCRGYLLTVIRDRFGTTGAVVATSVAFGVLHAVNPGATMESIAIVTLAGIFLAGVRVAYDSLYAAWTAHLAWNWMMAVPMHAPVSGVRLESPDYQMVSDGPAWVTGGTWGPEGGLAAALAMIAGLAFLYTRHRREES